MRISFVDIQNFRKLKNCRVELAVKETVFVGSNNSGKTSAMDAMIAFLKKSRHKDISTSDFTLSNWKDINKIADDWISAKDGDDLNLSMYSWRLLVPSLDIWLEVKDNEVHYVSHIIPTLDWSGGKLGVRLSFEPKDTEELYKAFKKSFEAARKVSEKRESGSSLKLWPQSMREFLDRELHNFFSVKAYILDPSKINEETPQDITSDSETISREPFDGLFKIDVINAQRGFSDPNSKEGGGSNKKLTSQLVNYFDNHLNPNELPEDSDLDALEAIDSARTTFDKKLKESFKASIGELEGLNYPGFSDPKIMITSKLNPIDGLNHDASVQFNVSSNDLSPDTPTLNLPERYNGLGYQNLISMIFNLIRYRDEWMRVGKIGKRVEDKDYFIEPLHIILIEEPEAHLHAQVQQVFIKKAYEVLRNHSELGKKDKFSTQLIVSTHSSHIAHEVDFINLRYFKRIPAKDISLVPYSTVINLSTTFGDNSDTSKFATRYLKATHCDLFFADAVILVEGPAERMLVPHFIKSKVPNLDRSYISMLEIGGSHAHRMKPLIETLGLLSLIITDLDSIKKDSTSKIMPETGKEYRTGNDTIKTWVPKKTNLDEVLQAKSEEKILDGFVRVAYQYEMDVKYSGKNVKTIPYTFEDALVLSNIELFKKKTSSTGLLKKMAEAVEKESVSDACKAMFEELDKGSKKAEMALELLYTTEPTELAPPLYILEGLEWLQAQLSQKSQDFVLTAKDENQVKQ